MNIPIPLLLIDAGIVLILGVMTGWHAAEWCMTPERLRRARDEITRWEHRHDLDQPSGVTIIDEPSAPYDWESEPAA